MKRRVLWGLAGLCLLWVGTAHAGAGLTLKAGSLGIGVDGTVSVAPRVNVRGNLNLFKLSLDRTQSDVAYGLDFKLRSFSILLDLHPAPRVGFRLSAGMLLNKNQIDMASQQLSGNFTIGTKVYTIAQVGTLNGGVKFKTAAPYLGIGWGNAAGRRVGFAFDLGVAFQGSPQVSLRATGPIASDAAFLTEMNREVQNVQDDLSPFKYYPVISIGVTFKVM